MDINYGPYNAQEEWYLGTSDYVEGAKADELYKALVLLKDQTVSLDEINQKRMEKGYIGSPIIKLFAGNDNAVLRLDPVGEDGRTNRDPEVFLRDSETGALTPSPELTDKFYTGMEAYELGQREKARAKGRPEYMTPLTVRRGKQVKEQESKPIEGGGRSLA